MSTGVIDKNNNEIENIDDILLEQWKVKSVFESELEEEPDYCVFNNTAYALDLLHKHIVENSNICFHTDVDVDGVGTTLIFKRALENLGSRNHILLINKDKIHGIQQKHVDYFNSQNNIDLMIITDSSSNEISIIKQFNCDVLCIDHHDLLHSDLIGFCNDGKHRYVILNNNIDNYNANFDIEWLKQKNPKTFSELKEYKAIHDMSCALVVYELLRLYCNCFGHKNLLNNLRLYQWVGITLFTDCISTLNDRNQWYLNKTVFSKDIEASLQIIVKTVNSYKATLDKSFISYSFAPLINKAIRAGAGNKALFTIANAPDQIGDLRVYALQQDEAIYKATKIESIDSETGIKTVSDVYFGTKNIIYDIGKLGIHPNYTGVIASKLAGNYNTNAAIFITSNDGICKGSFRGKQNVNYRQYFANFSPDIYAQGHPSAFGFQLRRDQLDTIMDNINSIENAVDTRALFSVGNIRTEERGRYHIVNPLKFKQTGAMFKIANGNSKVIDIDNILIKVKASDVTLKDMEGKVFVYNVLGGAQEGGFQCKAFKPITTEYCYIYSEYSNGIELYIR